MKEIIKTFEDVKGRELSVRNYFVINKKAEKLPLFVPVYKPADCILAESREPTKYVLNKKDFSLVKNYFEYLGDERIVLVNHNTDQKVLNVLKRSFNESINYYRFEEEIMSINKPVLILSKILDHFSLIPEKFDRFEKVKRGKFIVHFERVRFNPDKRNLEKFLKKIKEVGEINKKEKKIKELQLKLFEEGIKEQDLFSRPFNGIKIKYVPNHYYYPIILSETKQKISYLNHIIDVESEVKFIKELDEYLARENNLFDKKFDWWFFSKLDETTDEVYIPWYNSKSGKIEHFKPDFIFWLKERRNKNYHIVFVDPKGTEYAEAYRKIDGFRKMFENRLFPYSDFNIRVRLFCKPKDKAYAEEKYKKYWLDNIHTILEAI